MVVNLYKVWDGRYFNDPSKVIIFDSKADYSAKYAAYIEPARFWTGEGLTYNIELLEVCQVPLTALEEGEPIYLSTSENGKTKYYYINRIERTAQKAQLYITLDTFATYYGASRFDLNSIVTKSNCLLRFDHLIPLPSERTAIKQSYLTRSALGASFQTLYFAMKIKVQSAKTISTEAWANYLFAAEVVAPSNPSQFGQKVWETYQDICNTYEIKGVSGLGLAIEIEEIYLLDDTWFSNYDWGSEYYEFHTIGQDGQKKNITFRTILGFKKQEFLLKKSYSNINRIIIGSNEIELNAYYSDNIKVELEPIFNMTDFDILLKYEGSRAISIKQYYQLEVGKSTQETSLQTMSRYLSYAFGGGSGAVSAASKFAASGFSPAAGVAIAGDAIRNSEAPIISDIMEHALKSHPYTTSFKNVAFNIYFENLDTRRTNTIYQEYCADKQSQAMAILNEFGINEYYTYFTLEHLVTLPRIVQGEDAYLVYDRYFEIDAKFEGIPLDYARELETLFAGGVKLIHGEN